MPGTEIITNKGLLPITLTHMFGPRRAFTVIPPSFSLPDQYLDFAAYIRQTKGAGVWALKEDIHRGEGVVTAPGPAALWMAFDQVILNDPRKRRSLRLRYALAQKFVDNQYTIHGRPCVLRVWAVVSAGNSSVRGYLFKGGILPFGSVLPPDPDSIQDSMLIVNLFTQNRSTAADPWSLEEFRRHIEGSVDDGQTVFSRLWDSVQKSTAVVLAATVQSIQGTTSRLKFFQGGAIEVMGLDFVIDSTLDPWLIEVNYLPSMARKVIRCINPDKAPPAKDGRLGRSENLPDTHNELCVPNAMDAEKEAFLKSLLRMVAARHHSARRGHNATTVLQATAAPDHKALQPHAHTCNVTDKLLGEILDAQAEAQGARSDGGPDNRSFEDLTAPVYGALQCLHLHGGVSRNSQNDIYCQSVFPERKKAHFASKELLKHQVGLTSFKRYIMAHLIWAAAQVRRVTAKFEALFGLEGKPAVVLPPVTGEPLVTDDQRLAAAWFQLPQEDRQRAALSPTRILDKLCSIGT